MLHLIVSVVVLCALLCTCSVTLESPCPEVFRYEPEVAPEDGQWYGNIILQRKELRTEDQINILFNKPILKLKIYAEKVWTEDNKNFLISNPILRTDIKNTAHVRFQVIFKKKTTPPKLETILFNNRSICALKRKTRNTINEECGKVAKDHTEHELNDETNANIKNYPWHAAIFKSINNAFVYQCGGSLISKQHIITAAHCVLESQRSTWPVNADILTVYLGLENRKRFRSDNAQEVDVLEATIHPEFNLTNYHNDLSILKLKSEVTITDHVRPICLWNEDDDLAEIVHRLGHIAGWRVDGNGTYGENLRQAQLPVVPEAKCLRSHPEVFGKIYGINDFCAGFGNSYDTSVCNADSGGGLAFKQEETNDHQIWKLRGIVSVSVLNANRRFCDPSHYIVLTDTAKYLPWIRQQLQGLGSRPNPPDSDADITLLLFKPSDKNKTKEIESFLRPYNKQDPQYIGSKNMVICEYEARALPGKFCDVRMTSYPCVPNLNNNFTNAGPCVYLKLNKIIGWVPEVYNNTENLPKDMPQYLQQHIKNLNGWADKKLNTVWIDCVGKSPVDDENIGPIQYLPNRGFPGYYFPFENVEGYLSPLVAVYFENPIRGVVINVVCKAWVKNIQEQRGSVHFELLVD